MSDYKMLPGGYAEARQDYDRMTGVDRAVANSPPPLSDVGDDVEFMMDEGMGQLKGDEFVRTYKNCAYGGALCWTSYDPVVKADERCSVCPYKEENSDERLVSCAGCGKVHSASGPCYVGDSTEALLNERQKTHGSFAKNATYGQVLRDLFRDSDGWKMATPREREALDYIAGKLSRILSGHPGYADHWDDIAGYARLAALADLQS